MAQLKKSLLFGVIVFTTMMILVFVRYEPGVIGTLPSVQVFQHVKSALETKSETDEKMVDSNEALVRKVLWKYNSGTDEKVGDSSSEENSESELNQPSETNPQDSFLERINNSMDAVKKKLETLKASIAPLPDNENVEPPPLEEITGTIRPKEESVVTTTPSSILTSTSESVVVPSTEAVTSTAAPSTQPSPADDSFVHLSVVLTSRDDHYGGDSLDRLARFLQQWLHYPWSINVEIIVVEWNVPPEGMMHLYEENLILKVLTSPNRVSSTQVKFITVPSEHCKAYNHPGFDCPLFEFQAKNVGLRRSKGEWKLATNQDDLFSQSLLQFIDQSIASKSLDLNGFYQCPRGAINRQHLNNLPYDAPISVVNQCTDLQYNRNGTPQKCPVRPMGTHVNNCGDFQFFHASLLNFEGGGFLEISQNWRMDSEFLFRALHINRMRGYVIADCPMCHQDHTKNRQPPAKSGPGGGGIKKCDQESDPFQNWNNAMNALIDFLERNEQRHPNWIKAYDVSASNWGLNGVTLPYKIFT